jgi:hypothetical protein
LYFLIFQAIPRQTSRTNYHAYQKIKKHEKQTYALESLAVLCNMLFWLGESEHVGAGVIGHVKRFEDDERCRSLFFSF